MCGGRGGSGCVEEEGVVDVCSGCVWRGQWMCVEGAVEGVVEEGVVDVCEGGGSGGGGGSGCV